MNARNLTFVVAVFAVAACVASVTVWNETQSWLSDTQQVEVDVTTIGLLSYSEYSGTSWSELEFTEHGYMTHGDATYRVNYDNTRLSATTVSDQTYLIVVTSGGTLFHAGDTFTLSVLVAT